MEDKLIYKDLSYKLRGILFEVHNELGRFRNEKQYGDALAYKLNQAGIIYKREVVLPISFPGENNGRNRVDFVIEEKIILELKSVPSLSRNDYYQCQRYLESSNYDLALLINFRSSYLMVRRILNYHKYNHNKIVNNP